MPAAPPAVAELVTYAASSGLLFGGTDALVEGGNLFRWKLPPMPHRAVALQAYGGLEPEEGFGVQGIHYDRSRLQWVVRGALGEDKEAVELAQALIHAMAKINCEVIGATLYHRAWPLQSTPNNMGEDSQGRPLYGFNIQPERDLVG